MKKEKVKPNWLDPQTTAENEILPRYVKWAWLSRGLSLGMNVILMMQITFYCTDILGMTPALVGTLFLASKVFDGVTDLLVGYIIDRTHTKIGKARPYEIFIVFVWVLTIFLFSAPNLSTAGLCIYVIVLYTLINSVCATFLNGTDAVYLARSIRSEKNRVSVMSFNGGVTMVFSIVVMILLPQLIANIGTTRAGWRMIALIFAVPMLAIGLFRFLLIKEVAAPPAALQEKETKKEDSFSLRTGLGALSKNKYLFLLAGIVLLASICANMGTAISTYYFKYIYGDIGMASIVSLANVFSPIFIFAFPLLSKKFGSMGILRIGIFGSILGFTLRGLGGTNMVTMLIGSLFSSIGGLPVSLMINIYLIDCMDYGEFKTGVRVEGLLNSVTAFCNKVGGGLASGLVGVIMGMTGYDGNLAVQGATATNAIIGLFNWLPMVLTVVMFVLAMLYKLDKEIPGIRKALEERHAAKR